MRFEPRDPRFAERVAASFARQGLMATLGATLGRVAPGEVEIELPVRDAVGQQHGFVHGGAVASIADSVAGYAALTLIGPGMGVLTVEFKISFLAPARGERLVARGRVVKPGRTIIVSGAEVFGVSGDEHRPVALLSATMMAVEGRDGVAD